MGAYFNFHGRLSRDEFHRVRLQRGLAGSMLALIAGGALWFLSALLDLSAAGPWLFIIFAAALIFGTSVASLAATIRRLHDLGRSGWWSAVFLAPLPVVYGLVAGGRNTGLPMASLALAAMAPVLWFGFELEWRKGQPESNKHGEPPPASLPSGGPFIKVEPAKTRDLDAELKAASRDLHDTEARLRR